MTNSPSRSRSAIQMDVQPPRRADQAPGAAGAGEELAWSQCLTGRFCRHRIPCEGNAPLARDTACARQTRLHRFAFTCRQRVIHHAAVVVIEAEHVAELMF